MDSKKRDLAKLFASFPAGSEAEEGFLAALRIVFYDDIVDIVEDEAFDDFEEEEIEVEFERKWHRVTHEFLDPFHSRSAWAEPVEYVKIEAVGIKWDKMEYKPKISNELTNASGLYVVIAHGLWKGEKRWVLGFDKEARIFKNLASAEDAAVQALADLAVSLRPESAWGASSCVTRDGYPPFVPPKVAIKKEGRGTMTLGDFLKEQIAEVAEDRERFCK